MPQVLKVHQLHCTFPYSMIPLTPWLSLLCWGSTPLIWCTHLEAPACYPYCPHPGPPEELGHGVICLSLQIWVGSSLPSLSCHQHLPLNKVKGIPIQHSWQQLTWHPLDFLIHQCLWHYRDPPNQGRKGLCVQTQFCSRRLRDTLYPFCHSHGNADIKGPWLHTQGHRLVVISRIYGPHPTTYHILQCRHLGAHDPEPVVLAPLSTPPHLPSPPGPQPAHSLTIDLYDWPNDILLWLPDQNIYDHPGTSPSDFTSKSYSKSASKSPFEISQVNSIW